ncbi:threonine transporter [Ensifer soli]|uniref:threonine transporter n=1 Tax=Ciceribacter sp. sgz301302 TaxID=3342379 RepID=UPI0035B8093E
MMARLTSSGVPMSPFAFLATALLILSTPGPTNTLLAANGAGRGWRASLTLPLAEALGYILAVGGYVLLAETLRGVAFALPALKLAAAVWLLVSAFRLWRTPAEATPGRAAFRHVLVTTLLNPKAMIVGTAVIPAESALGPAPWVLAFAALSTIAGFAWVLFGAHLPGGWRRHAYRAAALVLGAFSLVALRSAIG